jgi:transposase-like protein
MATGGLPPSNTVRWTPQRKALVVEAVRSGVISLDEACRRYQLSEEEFLAWRAAIEAHGIAGVHITRFRYFHSSPARR